MPFRRTSRPRREAHEKSMGSYEIHAWRDALDIARDLVDVAEDGGLTVPEIRKQFLETAPDELETIEQKYADLIAEYLQKSISQRPAFLRRISKNVGPSDQCLFLALCIIGALRSRDLLELRDNFRMVLAPGRGNRVTIASVYLFADEVRSLFNRDWPTEVFDALGVDDIFDDIGD